MDKKKSLGILGAIIVAAASGSYAISLDFSQTNISSDDDTTINQGDTNIFNEITDRLAEEIVEAGIEACEENPDLAICP